MKKIKVKNKSIKEFINDNFSFKKYDSQDINANFFKDELYLSSAGTSRCELLNYKKVEIHYQPYVENCEKVSTKLIYKFTYLVEKYDDVKLKLVLDDFEIVLED